MVGIQLTTIDFLEGLIFFRGVQTMEGKLDVSDVGRIGCKDALNGGIG